MNTVEKNQAIGLLIITGILLVYFTFFSNTNESKLPTPETVNQTMSEAVLQPKEVGHPVSDMPVNDSTYSDFKGTEQSIVVENDQIKVYLSSKGALLRSAQLKEYKTYRKQPLFILDTVRNHIDWTWTSQGKIVSISDIYFTPQVINTDSGTVISFTTSNAKMRVQYVLPKSGYVIKYFVQKDPNFLPQVDAPKLIWWSPLPHNEKDITLSRNTSTVTYYYTEGSFKSLSETSTDPQKDTLTQPTQWVGFKQKFFTAALIAEGSFINGSVSSKIFPADTTTVKVMQASLTPSQSIEQGIAMKWYVGPNKLNVVKGITTGFEENVYLGWPIINGINRYTIAPLFTFLEKFISNYGIIIICLVLIIKAVLFPLSFQAYKSMAKIKVLKPELDEIKAKAGDDMALMQQEQMKLYQQVGVNPLSGCIPVLLQMPVLLAMFNFFPNAIELRQQAFWWAEDLSTFDSVLTLPFKIPVYGDHVSLFALLMTASTILYTWYNNQVNVSATGPMVAMSYIMPIIFLVVLNSMPAGLSFYYFISNLITVGQQFLIKMFVDEKAIRAKLDHNKANADTRKPNRFQQRLMAAMEQQQELKKQQQIQASKTNKNKK